MPDLVANLSHIQQQVIAAAEKVNRNYRDIKLVAVSKTVSVETMKKALSAGITVFGENRVQEMTEKIPHLPGDIEWHLIGNLQTNKVKYIINQVHLIHSLERIALAKELSKRGGQAGRDVDVLVEVNVAGESSKHGLSLLETSDFIAEIASYPNLKVHGLMTVAPYVSDPEEVRPVFRGLKQLADKIRNLKVPGVEMDLLSMGMSNDFTIAIEEGANIIRVGTKLFGER